MPEDWISCPRLMVGQAMTTLAQRPQKVPANSLKTIVAETKRRVPRGATLW
jgi:hypothetical protein